MIRRVLKYGLVAILAIVVLIGAGFAVGALGVPAVEDIQNRFSGVNESSTVVETDIVVDNPNPIGVSLGGLGVDYGIYMNDVAMAEGSVDGVNVGTGRSTIGAATVLDNERIPEWWYTHLDNGEVTEVVVDADVSHSLLGGGSVSIPQEETVSTDILGGFNSTETQPMNAGTVVPDPVLYLNETAAWWGEDVSPQQTPMHKEFTVYNPKPWPYTLTEIGYTVEMNGIQVGEGATEDPTVIGAGETETIHAETVIENSQMDEWWASHLRNNEVTDLEIDFYVVVDPDPGDLLGENVGKIRIDNVPIDYGTEIETDIFGTKGDEPPEWLGENGTGDPNGSANDGGASEDGTNESTGGDSTPTPTPEDDGVLSGDEDTPIVGDSSDDGLLGFGIGLVGA